MTNTDLNQLSRDELIKLRKEVDKALSNLEARTREKAIAAMEKAALEYGFTVNDLLKDKAKSKTVSAPKYMHPTDATLTWTGRGPRPKWLKDELEAGKTLEDFKI